MRQFRMIGVTLLTGLLTSCQPSAPPPTVTSGKPAAAEAKLDASPIVEIRSYQELDLEPGAKLSTWSLRASRVQEFTARLLVIKDGKSEVAQELTCKWDQWPESKTEAMWRLYYLLQNGEAYGAKNKRLPAITLHFDDPIPSRIAKRKSNQFVEGEFVGEFSEVRKDNTLDSSHADVIYYRFYDPAKGDSSVSLSRTVDGLIEASKGGRTVVAIVVEWKPFGRNK